MYVPDPGPRFHLDILSSCEYLQTQIEDFLSPEQNGTMGRSTKRKHIHDT